MSTAYIVHAEDDLDFVRSTLIRPLPCNGYFQWVSSCSVHRQDSKAAVGSVLALCPVVLIVVSRAAVRSPAVALGRGVGLMSR